MTIIELAPGEHSVTLESDLGSVTQKVMIEAGVSASLVVPMGAPPGAVASGWLSVTAPLVVDLQENGRLLGNSGIEKIMLPAGKHEIELVNEHLGYRETRTVQVSPGRTAAIERHVAEGHRVLERHSLGQRVHRRREHRRHPDWEPSAHGRTARSGVSKCRAWRAAAGHNGDDALAGAAQRRSDKKMRTPFIVACILLLSTLGVHAQETVAAARDLYTSANYEDALAVLSRLDTPSSQPSDRMAINQYRAFCLLALGRMPEAERAIEAVLTVDLLYRPSDAAMSPRLRSAFAGVRQRILPSIVQQEYARAKTAFDREDFPSAIAQFDRVLQALADPDLGAAAGNLADLRTLATGFRDLSIKAAAPPPAPPAPTPPPAVAVAAAPVIGGSTVVPSREYRCPWLCGRACRHSRATSSRGATASWN